MLLSIQGNTNPIPVHRIMLTFGMSIVPIIQVQLKYEADDRFRNILMNHSLCYVEYGGLRLKFPALGIGYGSTTVSIDNNNIDAFRLEDNSANHVIQGILLDPPLRQWINHESSDSSDDNNTPQIQVYQRTEDELWEKFLNRMLDDKISKGTGVDDLCKNIPSDYGCLWRRKDWNNRYFLNQAISYYRYLTGKIEGWAMFNAKEYPISLISRLNKPLNVKDQWGIYPKSISTKGADSPIGFTAHRLFKDFDDEKRLEILDKLARRESPGISEEAILPKIPGPVQFGSEAPLFFARSITYHFTPNVGEERGIHVTMDVTGWDNGPKQNPFPVTYLKARFKEWVNKGKAKGKLISMVPLETEPKEWALDKRGESSPDLYAKLITPTFVRNGEQGLYSKFKGGDNGDELLCVLQAGQVPVCPGAQQVLNPHFEEDGIALNAERVVLSASVPNENDKLDDEIVHIRLARKGQININSHAVAVKGIGDKKTEVLLDGNESTIIANTQKSITLQGNDGKLDIRAGSARMESKEKSAFIQLGESVNGAVVKAEKSVSIISDKSRVDINPSEVKVDTKNAKLKGNSGVDIESGTVNIKSGDVNVGK
ncbi:MAG: hypothetical protein HQK65_01010 [Desulfamplus sp.]|nr:hypothetical protein [Desulfamplus sp.]